MIPVALLILVALPGCSSSDAGTTNGSPGGRGSGATGRTVAVAVAPVERRTLARSVVLSAPVEPLRRIGVNSQSTGTVLEVAVQEGDRVRTGDLMARLDTREVEAQLERARATLANAETAFRRASEMRSSQIITEAEFEQARAAFGTAKSDVTLWETRLGFGHVRAPGAGVVTAKLIESGSAVSTNQRLFELADESVLVVRVQVSELDVVHLAGGTKVTVTLDAYPDRPIAGRIRRIFPSADPQSRLVPVEVALGPAPAGVQVRPGFLARVRLDLDAIADVLAVPAQAVGSAAEGPFVYAVASDTLERRLVQTGVTTDGWVQLLGGVAEGDAVVVSGHTNLRPGGRVRVAGRDTAQQNSVKTDSVTGAGSQ
ncbi:MAG: efflux RND transporter periplasmic adaptor subunit [Gemmatimonadota bacterium]|nr:efflux RND transporter periplasmic adaptor subunit [Gemmatimonadota bacterium]MDH5197242.1 efflux RND transporter periplasmic adaptor subunit [Gemmatimonadota bacterium]